MNSGRGWGVNTQVISVNLRCYNVGRGKILRIIRFGQLATKNVPTI